MTPTDIHAWVRTRWVELLDTARAATPGPWVAARSNLIGGYVEQGDDHGAHLVAEAPPCSDHPGRQFDDSSHIAAFDPTFTIAICEAALERLDRHTPRSTGVEPFRDIACVRCTEFTSLGSYMPWPCVEFDSDAAPFRTRPDYPEELKQ